MPSRQRLAFSTNAFKKARLDEALETISGLGYAGCEIMADQPHISPLAMTTSEMEALGQRLKSLGLYASNVNAFTGFFAAGEKPTGDTYHPTWVDNNKEARALRIAHTSACVRLAAALGARTVSVQPGGPLIGTTLSRQNAGERFAEGIAAVAPVAREHNITLAIEPEPGLLLQTTAEYGDWKRQYLSDEPLVKMNFDIGHAFCAGEDPAAVAREMAGEYAHIHLEDIADSRVHQHLVPGEGAIDFKALFAALDEVGYHGWITVELYPFLDDAAGVAKKAMKYLCKLVD